MDYNAILNAILTLASALNEIFIANS